MRIRLISKYERWRIHVGYFWVGVAVEMGGVRDADTILSVKGCCAVELCEGQREIAITDTDRGGVVVEWRGRYVFVPTPFPLPANDNSSPTPSSRIHSVCISLSITPVTAACAMLYSPNIYLYHLVIKVRLNQTAFINKLKIDYGQYYHLLVT